MPRVKDQRLRWQRVELDVAATAVDRSLAIWDAMCRIEAQLRESTYVLRARRERSATPPHGPARAPRRTAN
ncbi:MAG TPA: hypothetical protein VLX92_14265 [Kofleriaceae bacterium]|nr:hypothetical protein [Kofleriaceae bacterium]